MKFDEAMLMLRAGFKSSAAADAAEFAAEFAKTLPKDATITLSGDLGTGKTNFVKGIAKGLGVAEKVKSPSYNVYSIYTLPDGRKFCIWTPTGSHLQWLWKSFVLMRSRRLRGFFAWSGPRLSRPRFRLPT